MDKAPEILDKKAAAITNSFAIDEEKTNEQLREDLERLKEFTEKEKCKIKNFLFTIDTQLGIKVLCS